MKTKLFLPVLLLIISFAQAQIKFNDTESSAVSIIVDPRASIKEGGLNIGAEASHIEGGIYIHSGIQTFTVLQGGYYDWITSIGVVLKLDTDNENFKHILKNCIFYAGPRVGFIKRAVYYYPTWGVEVGTDYKIGRIIIGLRATDDYRTDFYYYGAPSIWKFNGFVKIGFSLFKD